MRKLTSLVLLFASSAYAQPAAEPQQPPPGSTHAQFLSTTGDPWDVSIDQQLVCTTPCAMWVPPAHFVALHSHEDSPVRLDVGYLAPGDVTVAGKPLENGKYAGGIVATTFGGMGLVTGITLAAVGCTTNHSGMCTAGAITGLGGAFLTAGGIYLMKAALPEAHIGPASPYVAGNQVGLAGSF